MNSDVFGDLEKWEKVLKTLDALKESKKLDEHQAGLARILRAGDNWRLIEKVLECGKELRRPEDEFLLEILNIIADRTIYLDARILALDTLVCLFPRMDQKESQQVGQAFFVQKIRAIMHLPASPLLREALAKSFQAMTGSP